MTKVEITIKEIAGEDVDINAVELGGPNETPLEKDVGRAIILHFKKLLIEAGMGEKEEGGEG